MRKIIFLLIHSTLIMTSFFIGKTYFPVVYVQQVKIPCEKSVFDFYVDLNAFREERADKTCVACACWEKQKKAEARKKYLKNRKGKRMHCREVNKCASNNYPRSIEWRGR
jgi:hypothetical protein